MKQLGQTAIILIIVALVVGFLIGWALGQNMDGVSMNGRNATTTPRGNTNSTSTPANNSLFPSSTSTFNGTGTRGISTGGTGFRGTPDLVADVASGAAAVTAANQAAGATATISSVTLPATGWVAIREEGGANVSGRILGARRLTAGTHNNVSVTLLKPTVAGQTYYATVYRDNGDGSFAKASDFLLTVNGQPIVSIFRAQ
jgi:hypothetical protein